MLQVPGPDRICLISIVMKLGGRVEKNLEKWRTVEIRLEDCYKLVQIFSLYGSCAGRAMVCKWDLELLLQIM